MRGSGARDVVAGVFSVFMGSNGDVHGVMMQTLGRLVVIVRRALLTRPGAASPTTGQLALRFSSLSGVYTCIACHVRFLSN